MPRKRRPPESDEAAGAPEWMVTFSDCMTLLLTFFVLLLSFSSFDEKVFRKLQMIFCEALPTVAEKTKRNKDAFLPTEQIVPTEELFEGSEKPTLVKGKEDNLKEETEPENFRQYKIFLWPSENIFWGRGTIISHKGRRVLATMSSFLDKVPGRVVISENNPGVDGNSEKIGLPRAWAIMEYLTKKEGLDKKRFSLSAASTIVQENFEGGGSGGQGTKAGRRLEIVLLERSIYN